MNRWGFALSCVLALGACTSASQEDPAGSMSSAGTSSSGGNSASGGAAMGAAGSSDAAGSPAGGSSAGGSPAGGAGGSDNQAGESPGGASAGGSAGDASGGMNAGGTAGNGGAGGESGGLVGPFQVLAFTKTTGFRHDSIDEGVALLEMLGLEHDFTVTQTEDGADFTEANLAQYAVVVFMNASGDLLDDTQQTAFEAYIQGGGGYVGVHCASCGEDDWAWYGELVGARFTGHPAIQEVTINVEDQTHPSTAHLPAMWIRDEEPYNFDMSPRPNVTVLATFDEASYQGGSMGDDHPIIWCHEFQGGRSWYTGLGHIADGYSEEYFMQMILGAVEWAAHRKN